MRESAGMVNEKRKKMVESAVRWLKERGVNPHLGMGDIEFFGSSGTEKQKIVCFNTKTGKITLPDPEVFGEDIIRGVIEHEAFHRGDHLEKFGGTKKKRREVYAKWEAAKKIMDELEKHKEHMDEGHPLYQALEELALRGYSLEESLIKLWCENPELFRRTLETATGLRIMEKELFGGEGPPALKNAKETAKQFFMLTPVLPDRKSKYFKPLTETIAQMISEVRRGRDPIEGLKTARARITSPKYYGNTGLEGVARSVANKYLFIAQTLKEKGLNNDQIVRATLALHKNVYLPEHVDTFAKNRRMLEVAAELIKSGAYRPEDIREAIAAQALTLMGKTVKKAIKTMKKDRKHRATQKSVSLR